MRVGSLVKGVRARLKIISFIQATQPDVIEKILSHCGLVAEAVRSFTLTLIDDAGSCRLHFYQY